MCMRGACRYSSSLSWAGTQQVIFEILKFSLIVRPREQKQNKGKNTSFSSLCLCPLGLTAKLNVNIKNSLFHLQEVSTKITQKSEEVLYQGEMRFNRREWLGRLVNIKEVNKQAEIHVGSCLTLYIFCFVLINYA